MKTPKNYKVYKDITQIIESARGAKESTENGVIAFVVYKKRGRAETKMLMNGFTLEEADVVIRDLYGKIYELRKRNDKKMQKLDKKIAKKKGI